MNAEETDLRAGLHRLTDQPHPLNASVDLARAKGRRIIRWRRAGTFAGTAVAAGAVVLSAVAVLPGGEKATGNNIAGSSSSTARPNPYVQRASFGWLPQEYGPVTTDFEDGIFFLAAGKWSAAAGTQFFFRLFPAGPEPALGSMRGGVPAKAIAAAPVNGRAAHWMQPPPPGPGTAPGEARLRIQFGPKQWGELEYDAAPGATDLKAALYKVARAIKIHDTPQAFPSGSRVCRSASSPGTPGSPPTHVFGTITGPRAPTPRHLSENILTSLCELMVFTMLDRVPRSTSLIFPVLGERLTHIEVHVVTLSLITRLLTIHRISFGSRDGGHYITIPRGAPTKCLDIKHVPVIATDADTESMKQTIFCAAVVIKISRSRSRRSER
jgi:hypothetical protein